MADSTPTVAGSRRRRRFRASLVSVSRLAVAGLGTVALAGAALVGSTVSTASAATSAFTLTMTSGSIVIHGGSPTALPTPSSIAGHVDSTTGSISGATLTIPAWHESNTGSTETIHFYETSPGSGSGTINYAGNVSYSDTLAVEVHITSPITQQCVASPISILLTSTSPYNTSTHDVTLKEAGFNIPNFSSTNCGFAASSLDSTFSGSSTTLTLNLHGTLPEPPPPTQTSSTVLTATPASPQLAGTAVTLKATVKKSTGAAATTATGTMQFRKGTTVLATESVTSGVSTYTTSSLPVGTDSLTAVYSGDSVLKSSTSSPITYQIKPAPSVSVTNLPSTVHPETTTLHPFTVVVTNPGSGLTLTHLYLELTLTGIRNLTPTTVVLQYEDSSSAWCTLLGFHGTSTLSGYVAGTYSGCAPGSYPASFSLGNGSAKTFHFRIGYPTVTPGLVFYGPQKVTGTLYTGSCSSSSTCTAVAPLSGSAAPSGSATMYLVPTAPVTTSLQDDATRPATSTVRQTFDVGLRTAVAPTPTVRTIGLPAATGTVSYTLDGHVVTTSTLSIQTGDVGSTPLSLFNTATLPPATYTLIRTYSGDKVYASSSLTQTFTVVAAPTGTAFVCQISGLGGTQNVNAYVTAHGTVPATGAAGTNVSVTNVTAKLIADPSFTASSYNTSQSPASIGFAPTGSTSATAGPITFSGTTGTVTEVTGTWTGMSTTVPLSGTSVQVGVNSIRFGAGFDGWNCVPAAGPTTTGAPVGTPISVTHHTPVTWTVSGCQANKTTTAPAWANTEEIIAKGAGGGGGGEAFLSTGHAGAGGAGGAVTAYLTITGGAKVSATTGCAGHGAPQGWIPTNGGAAGSGWSSGGHGGQGYYCSGFFCTHNDGTGGGGGGSTGVCNGTTTCTSTSGTVVAVAGGGGAGGETMCATGPGGNGGQAGNASSTSANGGAGPSGSNGVIGGPTKTGTMQGSPGGPGGANNKAVAQGLLQAVPVVTATRQTSSATVLVPVVAVVVTSVARAAQRAASTPIVTLPVAVAAAPRGSPRRTPLRRATAPGLPVAPVMGPTAAQGRWR